MKEQADRKHSSNREFREHWVHVDAPEWAGPHLRICYVSNRIRPKDSPHEDLGFGAMSLIAGWIHVTEGTVLLREGSRQTEIRAGDSILYCGPLYAELSFLETSKLKRVGLYGEESTKLVVQLIERYGSFFRFDFQSAVFDEFEKLQRLADDKAVRPSHEWSTACYGWWLALCRELALFNPGIDSGHKLVPNSRLVGVEYPTFRSYATQLGYNPDYLSRRLKKLWNISSATNMLRDGRLQKAEKLIIETRLPISEISKKVKYSRTSSFISAFKKRYGSTPLSYRHQFGTRHS
jgi:AraC-like DNA-binding protein